MAKCTRAPARPATRASARNADTRAQARPAPRVSPRRLNVTPALLADVRRRYEQTDEPLATMAADLGCSIETVRNLARRERWVRYVPPPRDLSPAAKLRLKAAALERVSQFPPPLWGRVWEGGGDVAPARPTATPTPIPSPQGGGEENAAPPAPDESARMRGGEENAAPPAPDESVRMGGGEETAAALARVSQFPPPLWGRVREGGGDVGSDVPTTTPTPDPSPQGGGEENAAPASQQSPLVADTADALHRELQALLAELRATRARMQRDGHGKHDLREAAQAIANLTATLERLQRLQAAAPPSTGPAYDDMPADLDAFRDALARRIDAFVASRTDSRDADGDAAAAVDAA